MSVARTAMAIALCVWTLWSAHAQGQMSSDSTPTSGQERFALVIGNDDYWYEGQLPKLHNAVRDAEAIARKLEDELGFTVSLKRNADQKTILTELWALAETLRQRPNGVGLFYFAGHGIQVKGRNYLMGVEANLDSPAIIGDLTVPADRIVDDMIKARNRLNIVILDACRDDPFASADAPARSVRLGPARPAAAGSAAMIASGPGLAAMQVPQTAGRDVLIAFSAGAGERASDGVPGGNSLFAETLLRTLDKPGLPAVEVFRQTQIAVSAQTRRKQSPFVAIQGALDFKFRPGEQQAAVPAMPAPRPGPAVNDEADWKEARAMNTLASFTWYLNRHPHGAHHTEANLQIKTLAARRDEAERREASRLAQRKEADHWAIIKDSSDPDLFEQFLGLYPKGQYARLAEIRLKQIRDKSPEVVPAPVDRNKEKDVLAARGPPPTTPDQAPAKQPAGPFETPGDSPASPGSRQQQGALPPILPPLAVATDNETRWQGTITRAAIVFEEGAICRSAQVDFRTRDGRMIGGTLILDDGRRFELDLAVKTGQRIAVEGTLPSRGVVSDVLVRLYDPMNLNFASYRFGGLIEGQHFAGSWRIDGYSCQGAFRFTRAPG